MRDARTNIRDALYEEPGPITKRYTAVGTVISLAALAVLAAAVVRQFYINGQLAPRYWTIFFRWTTWRFLGQGLLGTLRAAAMAGVVTFILGFILMTGRICNYRILRLIATAIIDFVRGVPTLLFIYFFFLVLPQLGIRLDAFWKVTLPVGISACGVVAEVLRSGVNAVPIGQKEAAYSLGMRETGIFLKVVFPQAIRYVIPALISELVIVVKDTTFAYVVNFPDLMQNAKVLISNYDAMLSVYLVVAVIYILINFLLNRLSDTIAKQRPRTLAAAELKGPTA